MWWVSLEPLPTDLRSFLLIYLVITSLPWPKHTALPLGRQSAWPFVSLPYALSVSPHSAVLRPNRTAPAGQSPAFTGTGWDESQPVEKSTNRKKIKAVTMVIFQFSLHVAEIQVPEIFPSFLWARHCASLKIDVFLRLVHIGFLSLAIKYFPEGQQWNYFLRFICFSLLMYCSPQFQLRGDSP